MPERLNRLDEGLSVLVIEPTPFVQRSYERVLKENGWNLLFAQDHEQALGLLASLKIDVIVAAGILNRLGGEQVIVTLLEKYSEIPVVVSASHLTPGLQRRLQTFGIRYFLPYPAPAGALAKAIRLSLEQPVALQEVSFMINKALVIDDIAYTRRLLSELLAQAGFDVIEARNGQSALEMLRANQSTRLITLDLNLPDIHGIDLLGEIRGKWPDIPVIVVTASQDMQRLPELRRLRIMDLLMKPIDCERFLDLVGKVSSAHGSSEDQTRPQTPVVLLAMPSNDLIEIIADEILDSDVMVEVCKDGFQVLSDVQYLQPSAIVLHLNIGGLDGVGVIRELRESGQNIPVVAISPTSDQHVLHQLEELGATRVFVTPLDVNELQLCIQNLIKPNSTSPV